jgi:hypothetical protein
MSRDLEARIVCSTSKVATLLPLRVLLYLLRDLPAAHNAARYDWRAVCLLRRPLPLWAIGPAVQ